MSEQDLDQGSSRQNLNHFLVYVHNERLSPIYLNDAQNSYEILKIQSTAQFVDCFNSPRPGCLVTDTNNDFFDYPNLNLMTRLLPVVMVTHSGSVRKAAEAARKGAHSVLRDFSDQKKVFRAVRTACLSDISGPRSPSTLRNLIATLTTKERQVIYMSLRGKTTKVISGELGVCHQTVDKHKKRALNKLKANGVVALINTLLDAHRQLQGISLPQQNKEIVDAVHSQRLPGMQSSG